ncbi:MAG: hypothetical protein AAB425_01415, partial [Bdellovibrionota bacterium]
FARTILTQAAVASGNGALLLARGDHIFNALLYRNACLGEGVGTRVLSQNLLTYGWYNAQLAREPDPIRIPASHLPWHAPPGNGGYSMRQFLELNQNRPIYLVNGFNTWDLSLREAHQTWPVGTIERVYPLQALPDFEHWRREDQKALAAWDWRQALPHAKGTWEYELQHQYWHTRHLAANRLVSRAMAGDHPGKARELDEALQIYENLLTDLPGREEKVIFKNLGVAYQASIPLRPDAGAKALAAWKRFVQESGPGDPDPDLPHIKSLISGR